MPNSTNALKDEAVLSTQRRLAEAIRAACIQAAIAGYEDASLSGLCHEGAWERAIDAMRELKLEAVIKELDSGESYNITIA
jgi:hypothetical protein